MIVKIYKQKSAYSALNTCLHNNECDVNSEGEIVGGNVAGNSIDKLTPEFNYVFNNETRYNGKEKFLPIRHVVFYPNNNDRTLDNFEIQQITEKWINDMGFQDCPYVVIKHKDEELDNKIHWHVITTNYNIDNEVVNEFYSYKKSNKICRQIEKDFGLITTNGICTNYFICTEYDESINQQHKENRTQVDCIQAIHQEYRSENLDCYYLNKIYGFNSNDNITYCRKVPPADVKTKLSNGDIITDETNKIKTASSDVALDTIKMMVEIAQRKGATEVQVYGNKEFVQNAWQELTNKNIKLSLTEQQEKLVQANQNKVLS